MGLSHGDSANMSRSCRPVKSEASASLQTGQHLSHVAHSLYSHVCRVMTDATAGRHVTFISVLMMYS